MAGCTVPATIKLDISQLPWEARVKDCSLTNGAATKKHEFQDTFVLLRNQLRQEISTALQVSIDERFSKLQKEFDDSLAERIVQLQVQRMECETKWDHRLSHLEVSIDAAVADIHQTRQSLKEFANELEESMKQVVSPKPPDMPELVDLKEEIQSLRKAAFCWAESKNRSAELWEEDTEAPHGEDDGSTQFPSDASDDTEASAEERLQKLQEANDKLANFSQGRFEELFDVAHVMAKCTIKLARKIQFDFATWKSEKEQNDLRLSNLGKSITSEEGFSIEGSAPKYISCDLRATLAHLTTRIAAIEGSRGTCAQRDSTQSVSSLPPNAVAANDANEPCMSQDISKTLGHMYAKLATASPPGSLRVPTSMAGTSLQKQVGSPDFSAGTKNEHPRKPCKQIFIRAKVNSPRVLPTSCF